MGFASELECTYCILHAVQADLRLSIIKHRSSDCRQNISKCGYTKSSD
jgi:hypothetical protein